MPNLNITLFCNIPTIFYIIAWNFSKFWYRIDLPQLTRDLTPSMTTFLYQLPHAVSID